MLEVGRKLEIRIVWHEPYNDTNKMENRSLGPLLTGRGKFRRSDFRLFAFDLSLKPLKICVEDKIKSIGRVVPETPVQ